MEKIYFSKEVEKLIDKLDFSRLGNNVAIKLHFGEKGCVTYLNPEIAKKIYDKLISLGKKATLVECNALYRGSRTTRKEHIQTAKEHGFDMPIDILDGEQGEEFLEFEGCKLGKGIKKYDSLLVLTHFKGHPMTGFGGALKNLGMGLGSRAGKLDMHCSTKPGIDKLKCTACKTCISHCGSNAIKIIDGKAEINPKLCTGCAMCISVCPQDAVLINWGKSANDLQKRMIDYASAALKLFKNKVILINVLQNITPECDCFSTVQKPIMKDVGFLGGYDAVSIDKASFDLVNKLSNNEFDKLNSIDKTLQINYATSLGIGKKEYKIIEL